MLLPHILEHTEDLWRRDLRGARLFVTGATGFFGKWITASLDHARRELGVDVQATFLSRQAPVSAEWIQGDVRDFVFPAGEYTHILHAATPASAALNSANPYEMFDIIVSGTRRVLEFTQASGAESLLLCSSGAVYGRQPLDVTHVREEAATGPDPMARASAYAEGKRAAELLCAISGVQRFVSARCFAFLGPHLPLDAHFAAGNFLRDALAGRNIVIQGDGTPLRSYLHPADLMIWLWTLLARGAAGRAYNVGSERAVSIAELAYLTRDLVAPTGVEVEIRGQAALPGSQPERYVPSTARARDELGLVERIALEEAIRQTAEFRRKSRV